MLQNDTFLIKKLTLTFFIKTGVVNYLAQFVNPKLLIPDARTCDRNDFKCGDKTCVRSGLICDGLPPQCADESDLEFCAKNMSLPCVGPKYEECPLIKECFIPDLNKGNPI